MNTIIQSSAEPARPVAGRAPVHVCLIRPPTLTTASAAGQDAVPPIGLAYIASALRPDNHKISVIDAVGLAVNQYTEIDEQPNTLLHGLLPEQIAARIPGDVEVLGISCMFSVEWPFTKQVIEAAHRAAPDATIIIGGEHVTACAKMILESVPCVDVCVLGEGEETIAELLSTPLQQRHNIPGIAYRNQGEITINPRRQRIRDIDSIEEPDWERFPVTAYIENALTHGANLGRSMPIMASRGCPYQCTFCSSPMMWTTRWKARDPKLVLAEIKKYINQYDVSNFDFYDLTAIVKKSWIKEFCELLIAENIHITWQLPSGTRSEAIDSDIAKLLYLSGCRRMNYAPESGSDEELKRIKKRINKHAMLQSVREATRQGIQIKMNFVFGFPGATWTDVIKTFGFIFNLAKAGAHDISSWGFCPYPGSELFDQLIEEGKLEPNDNYFLSLLSITDPAAITSYNDHFAHWQLRIITLASMLFFYSCSVLFRPKRAFEIIQGILKKDSSTKLTMALHIRARKQEAIRRIRQGNQKTVFLPENFSHPRKP